MLDSRTYVQTDPVGAAVEYLFLRMMNYVGISDKFSSDCYKGLVISPFSSGAGLLHGCGEV